MKKGDKAPDFSLQNTEGNYITLSEITGEGKSLLLFFPLAFSGICTDEMCIIRDNMKLYNSLKVNVAGISIDSFFTLREFKRSNNLNFILLSDFNKTASRNYQCIYEDYYGMKGVSKRGAFVIDRDKTILYAEILDQDDQFPDFNTIFKHLS
ncbi:MAG: peroxiredoxin [Balneolaceae bacterium]|jgi:peroxiredoxin|nr:MAG: peroxiredoxin [Balneolaceae bacterium]